MLFSSQRGQSANSQTANTGFSMLSAPGRQISDYLPAFGFIENKTDSDTFFVTFKLTWIPSLLSYLTHFIAFAEHLYFCITGSWIVGLAMGGVESKNADVVIDFSQWSL